MRTGPSGLTLETPGEGAAVFEIRSPYVIVPRVGKLETTDDDVEASMVKVDGSGVTLSVSVDNGLTWVAPSSPDLTPLVSGRYGYLLKLVLKGEGAVVRSLEATTWVQVHPASLPSLRKGRNEMRYVTGHHYGLDGHVVEIRTNGSDRQDFLKYLSEPPKDFDPARTTSRARGAFVVKVSAPPGMKIAWFCGGGNFTAHQGDGAPKTRNTMEWAAEEPARFTEFYRADVPAGQNHWHYNADVEVKLDAPARTLFLRYVGDPGVNNLRIFAHCVEDAPRRGGPMKITHGWKEKGRPKTSTVTLERPGAYEVVTEDDPVDDFVELSIPSSRR